MQAGIGPGIDRLEHELADAALDPVALPRADIDGITEKMLEGLSHSQDLVKLGRADCR